MLLHSPRCPVRTSPTARVSNTSTRRRFIGTYPKYTIPLGLISFKWHAPTWGKIRVVFKLLLREEAVPTLKQIRCVPPGYRSLAAPRRAPAAEPDGQCGGLLQEHISVEEDVALYWVTRLSLNATPSRYLNHIKAFFYYTPPCDFAWLHSNYQPCCSTRGFHSSVPLPFYGKRLISHNPNENTAVG